MCVLRPMIKDLDKARYLTGSRWSELWCNATSSQLAGSLRRPRGKVTGTLTPICITSPAGWQTWPAACCTFSLFHLSRLSLLVRGHSRMFSSKEQICWMNWTESPPDMIRSGRERSMFSDLFTERTTQWTWALSDSQQLRLKKQAQQVQE